MTAALEVTDLVVNFGGLRAVDGVDLAVPAGTLAGLIGPNGAGKTTTIDALCGFVPYSPGSVELHGQPIDRYAPHQRARAGLVRTFQSDELFDDLTVRENLIVAATPGHWWSPLVDAVLPRRSMRGVDVDFALDIVGLRDAATLHPPECSHGQRRLVGVARAVASRPKVLLLDEPAAGLDPDETTALGTVLRRLADEGVALLLVDHDMTLVLDVCTQLTVMDLGRVIAHGPTDAVRMDPAVVAAYLGTT